MPKGTSSLVVRASARQVEDLGSNSGDCQIFHLFRCVHYSLLPLLSVGRSNFDKGLHDLRTLILKRRKKLMTLLYYIVKSTVDSYEKTNAIYRYIHVY